MDTLRNATASILGEGTATSLLGKSATDPTATESTTTGATTEGPSYDDTTSSTVPESGREPVSGVEGSGTADEPYDSGNKVDDPEAGGAAYQHTGTTGTTGLTGTTNTTGTTGTAGAYSTASNGGSGGTYLNYRGDNNGPSTTTSTGGYSGAPSTSDSSTGITSGTTAASHAATDDDTTVGNTGGDVVGGSRTEDSVRDGKDTTSSGQETIAPKSHGIPSDRPTGIPSGVKGSADGPNFSSEASKAATPGQGTTSTSTGASASANTHTSGSSTGPSSTSAGEAAGASVGAGGAGIGAGAVAASSQHAHTSSTEPSGTTSSSKGAYDSDAYGSKASTSSAPGASSATNTSSSHKVDYSGTTDSGTTGKGISPLAASANPPTDDQDPHRSSAPAGAASDKADVDKPLPSTPTKQTSSTTGGDPRGPMYDDPKPSGSAVSQVDSNDTSDSGKKKLSEKLKEKLHIGKH